MGSAAPFDTLLLVECPLPWPHDVSEIPELASASARPGARVMAVVPRVEDAPPGGQVRVVHHRRVGANRLVGTDHCVRRDEVAPLLARILDDPRADSAALPSAIGAAPVEVLVCAHGRRDACCGRWGTLLHVELAARGDDVRLWRCSHTGGHRFAPTAITLPDGRAWAYVDADLVQAITTRTGDVADVAPHDRGNSALDPWAQAVEHALFEEHGWAWLEHDVTERTTDVAPDRDSASVALAWEGPDGSTGRVHAIVEVTRRLPVPVCGEPPEQATKSSPEYTLRELAVDASG